MLALILQSLRSWKSARPVAFLAAAALAIGIGSATGIFSVVEAVLLKPLSYSNSERYLLVRAEWRNFPGRWTIFSYGDALDYAARNSTLDAFGCYHTYTFNLAFQNRPLHVSGAQVSPALMRSLGIPPALGRWFSDQPAESAGLHSVVIADSLWHKIGANAGILGQTISINGSPYTVLGVMPSWFRFPPGEESNELWVPLDPDANQLASRGYHYLNCIAKAKPTVSEAQARAELQGILESLGREHPTATEPEIITTVPLLQEVIRYVRPRLLLLMAAALALLFITCANVASILLARSVARRRETAVRVALGATIRQLALQYFVEGLVVALAGAVLGSLLSFWLVRIIVFIAAERIPRADQISLDGRVLFFALALALASSLLFSLAPLWQALKTPPNEVLNEGVRSSASAAQRRLLRIFVIAEVALAFALLAVSGVLWEQLNSLYGVDPGFDPSHLLLADIYAPASKYTDFQAQQNYMAELISSIERLPGVESAGFTNLMPIVDAGTNTSIRVEGRPLRPWSEEAGFIEERYVSPDYFKTLRIPLIAGRLLNDGDVQGNLMPILINESLARLYWPRENPIGAYVRLLSWESKRFQVVGIVGDVRNFGLGEPPHPELYFNYRQTVEDRMQWAVRSSVPPAILAAELKRTVERIDPTQSIYSVQTMRQAIDNSLSTERVQSIIVAFFASAALVLSIIGVYGVVSYTVRRRATELGTRMAVGANSRDVLGLVMVDGFRMSILGTFIGLVLVLAANYLLKTISHMAITGPSPFFLAALIIGTLTLLASWFPSWRAAGLPPMMAIRNDSGSSWQLSRLTFRQLVERASPSVPGHTTGVEQTALLSAMAGAGREAESFPAALAAAVETLRESLRVESANLLAQAAPGEPYCSTGEALLAIPSDAFLVRRLQRFSTPLPLAAGDLTAWTHWANANDPARLAEIETLKRSRAVLAVPVYSQAHIVAVLLLGKPRAGGAFSFDQLRALPSAAAQLGLVLENGSLSARLVDQERLRRELQLASEVQKRLFPAPWPQTSAIQLTGRCLPARGIGGDYYDFLDLGNRQIGVALADVAGKGIAAALLMSVVQASLRSLTAMRGESLADLAVNMNSLLFRSTSANSYATFFYCQVDEGRRLRYINAGHNPPMLFRGASAAIEELSTGGLVIGLFAQAKYEEALVDLNPGDVLLLFSDGVSEAHNQAEDEFGEERLRGLLRKTAHLPVEEMATAILEQLQIWMSGAPQHDDLTFVVMRVR